MKKHVSMMAAFVAVAACLTGCGESGTSSVGAGKAQADCKAAASNAVDALRAVPELYIPNAAAKGTVAAGKSVWVVNLLSNDLTKNIDAGIKAAASALGMEFHELNGNGTAQSANQALSTALGAGADAIVTSGIDASIASNPLQKAKNAGVPVITILADDVDAPNDPLVYADITLSADYVGKAWADYALHSTGCDLELGNVSLPASIPLSHEVGKVTEKEIARLCSACDVHTIEMDVANLATGLPTQVQSMMKQHPGINYLAVGFDAAVPFAGPPAQRINKDVTLISANGLAPNLQMIIAGGVQDADMSFPPNDYIGWLAVHSVLAALSGTPGENQKIPMRLLDKTNIEDGDLTTLYPTYDGFQKAFEKAWGVG
ncbi:sugar ABC transporter substrate-binding protein [Actinomadura coerulea]|uniref:sugar ABC transporter substrate-binding protein n=1 Tax=Actinomadura coerulea TaxID=46159 RepID=UPI00341C0CC2